VIISKIGITSCKSGMLLCDIFLVASRKTCILRLVRCNDMENDGMKLTYLEKWLELG
jgi:hypothetical protein